MCYLGINNRWRQRRGYIGQWSWLQYILMLFVCVCVCVTEEGKVPLKAEGTERRSSRTEFTEQCCSKAYTLSLQCSCPLARLTCNIVYIKEADFKERKDPRPYSSHGGDGVGLSITAVSQVPNVASSKWVQWLPVSEGFYKHNLIALLQSPEAYCPA